jgi:ribosomal protein L12E/L44/L45/RPP1/RPP2
MNTLDVLQRFDPNDDVERLLRDTDTLLRPLRAPRATPLAKADLESLAQHIAKKLGQGVQKDAVGRGGRGGGGGGRPGRPGPRPWATRGGGPTLFLTDVPWTEDELDDLMDEDLPVSRRRRAVVLDGGANRAPTLAAEPKGLLDVFAPRHNLREMAKELILLEDHLAQPAKHCPDCIRKHLLKAEALAEEAVQLDEDGSQQERLRPLPGQIRNIQRAFLADTDRNALQQQVRQLRKVLSKESFDALAFKPAAQKPAAQKTAAQKPAVKEEPEETEETEDEGSTNRAPIVFALERGPARKGSSAAFGAKPISASPLPTSVVAALQRRLSAGVENTPAPVFFRTRNKDGTVTITEGQVKGIQGDAVVVTTLEPKPRTVAVPLSDTILDLSGADTFRAIPWPSALALTRKKGIDVLSIVPGTPAWQNIRVIASVLWPLVDSFALRYAGPSEPARQALLQRLLVAAVVNAAYESNLDAAIEGDSGKAVGLFQLREDGAGIGMSKADRKDAFLNTARIAQRFGEVRKFFTSLAETEVKVPGSTPFSAWTGLFARYVEAPSDRDGAQKVRGDTAATAFVAMPVVERAQPVAVAPPPSAPSLLPWLLGGITVTALAIGLGTSVVRARRG